MKLSSLWRADSYKRKLLSWVRSLDENFESVVKIHPGHFYSPLLDLAALQGKDHVEFDTAELWDESLCDDDSLAKSYEEIERNFIGCSFPATKAEGKRYYSNNEFFTWADAYVLSSLLRQYRPNRIVEVGSGFSSAVILDTCDEIDLRPYVVFVEPYPDRLESVIGSQRPSNIRIEKKRVQEVDLSVFTQLVAGDICFIDSSHVAKIGSDVTWLFLKVLPRLAPGVLIHIHDIFYPESYPIDWVKEGRAWNESIFLRAYLTGQQGIEVIAFNSWVAKRRPDAIGNLSRQHFLKSSGASFWFRKNA